jgi:pimeloyl-ACP methyl ester carboxylesterase|tara:strand:- start:4094 stop:4873 length:780 start_codon:yes stop_codon:yes gene_type:complete
VAYVKSGSAEIYYEVYGDGPCLVFAHGAGGNAASWWQQVPYFADRFKIITFDHRCFGRSTCPPEDIDMKYFADDLRAVLDAEEIKKAFLVCQSMGGWTGMRMVTESPQRVSALVMSHTPGPITNDEIRKVQQKLTADRTPVSAPFGSWAVAPDYQDNYVAGAHLYNQISSFNTNADRNKLFTGMGEPLPMEALKEYVTPTLFITAEQDQIFPPEMIHMVAELVPGALVKVLGDAGHSSYFESPALFNKTVDEFITSHLG